MSTRATYTLTEYAMDEKISTSFYIHSDGYSEGAAGYFYKMFNQPEPRYSNLMMQFIRANETAQIMPNKDCMGGLEFTYQLNENGELVQDEIDPLTDKITNTKTYKLWDFVNNFLTYDFREALTADQIRNNIEPKEVKLYPLTYMLSVGNYANIATTKVFFDQGISFLREVKANYQGTGNNSHSLKDALRAFAVVKSCYDTLSEQNNDKPFISLYAEANTFEQITMLLQEVNDQISAPDQGNRGELLTGFKSLIDQVELDHHQPQEITASEPEQTIDKTKPYLGNSVVRNEDRDGIEVKFLDKPNDIIRAKLKKNGFKWSNNQGIWWAKFTDQKMSFALGLLG